ncbi:CMGC family protein kinase [Trichomonas vaginalis G3]|uniref:non-specific serine/threonine protein kinase n=1 Tax=Trichomonas vaginalis (strain ATCC PRA-98 / G3) TaxID=412133 RepID=A2FZT3_TRIV3|nr:STKc CK2 alpha domain-containing protein [Trichomonas vaginalis G3]EAX89597.1 CMGC family protein kinase [Trichomonas vaginalis G3]KAI5517579.1 STKc CK2 alpha domain-containing protein [Trichomonas vaginalis G3]|eukprot:XP_001302527.1 CMGC family protein kinase [Trichomonas vaginalis G3]
MTRGRAVQRENPQYNIETVSLVYANVNQEKGPSWYDVENYELPRDSQDPYYLLDWVGTGKYSDVYTAKYGDQIVAIKVLKPVRSQKYNREAKILINLRGGPNIIQLISVVQNPKNFQYSFVFEYINDIGFDTLMKTATDLEARFYLYQLMRALQYCHSQGIMHRDVKPLNILYDNKQRKLRLIDWGLADFYHPYQRYNIHVASRNFKPIELLLDYQCYDYSVDIWSFGATMAALIFKKTPFFKGNNDLEMIKEIASVLGGEKLEKYMQKYGIPQPDGFPKSCLKKKAKPLESCLRKNAKKDLVSPEALDLLDKCLRYDHQERITAADALKHPYFDPVRDMVAN